MLLRWLPVPLGMPKVKSNSISISRKTYKLSYFTSSIIAPEKKKPKMEDYAMLIPRHALSSGIPFCCCETVPSIFPHVCTFLSACCFICFKRNASSRIWASYITSTAWHTSRPAWPADKSSELQLQLPANDPVSAAAVWIPSSANGFISAEWRSPPSI